MIIETLDGMYRRIIVFILQSINKYPNVGDDSK